MDLYVIQMLQFYLVLHRNSKSVSGNMREVCRVLIKSSQTTAGKHYMWRTDRIYIILFIHYNDAAADIVSGDQIYHGHIFTDFDILSGQCLSKKCLSDLLSCHIFIKEDSWLGMCTFSGECKLAVLIALEGDVMADKIADNAVGASDHEFHSFFIVFVVTCTHGILEVVLIIPLTAKHTDAALCKEGV